MEYPAELGDGLIGGDHFALAHQHWLSGSSQCGYFTDNHFAFICIHYIDRLRASKAPSGRIASASPLVTRSVWSGGQRGSTGFPFACICFRFLPLVDTGHS